MIMRGFEIRDVLVLWTSAHTPRPVPHPVDKWRSSPVQGATTAYEMATKSAANSLRCNATPLGLLIEAGSNGYPASV